MAKGIGDWTKMRTWDVIPPQCTYDNCFVEALWIDPWNGNYYCEVHKKVVSDLMEAMKRDFVE